MVATGPSTSSTIWVKVIVSIPKPRAEQCETLRERQVAARTARKPWGLFDARIRLDDHCGAGARGRSGRQAPEARRNPRRRQTCRTQDGSRARPLPDTPEIAQLRRAFQFAYPIYEVMKTRAATFAKVKAAAGIDNPSTSCFPG